MNKQDNIILNKIIKIKKGFFGTILIIFVFNLFLAGFLNLTSHVKVLKNRYFIMAELKNNLTKEKEKKIETKFLKLDEVTTVVYTDSYTAFQNLQKDLGIVIPKGENPLPNIFRIYFDNPKNIEKLQIELENTEEIKEFFVDSSYNDELTRKSNILKLFSQISLITSIFCLFILNTILKFQIQTDYLINFIKNENYSRNLAKAKNMNLLPSTIAILTGTVLFFNFYIFMRRTLIEKNILMNILSILEIIYIQLGITLIIILFLWFTPTIKGKKIEKNSGEI